MSALADASQLSRSRLSHQIDRMAAAGLVRRASCPEDGRGMYAELTQAGWDRLVTAAPDHVESVRHRVLDQLTPAEFEAWGRACAKIVAGLSATSGQEAPAEVASALSARTEVRTKA
jgi:DNA-binding MarR family transcriptional regulator